MTNVNLHIPKQWDTLSILKYINNLKKICFTLLFSIKCFKCFESVKYLKKKLFLYKVCKTYCMNTDLF